MKAILMLGLVAASSFATPTSATEYYARCQTCTGGANSGASWFAAAVALAQANNAQENDELWICKQANPNYSVLAQYIVTYDPVGSAADISWTITYGYDAGCDDFGV